MFQILQISRLRIRTDGDGIRTLIVTHECGLRCKYCLNPETWNGKYQSKEMTAAQLYDQISLDRPYFMVTDGGVTFGGGEPLQYVSDIQKFRDISRDDFTIFAETSLYVPEENVIAASKCVDRFIVDIKTMDPDIYRDYTGGSLDQTLRNLQRLIGIVGSDRITVRIPLILGFTTQEDQLRAKDELMQFGIEKFDLFKYTMARNK